MTVAFLIFILVVLIVAGIAVWIVRQLPLAAPLNSIACAVVGLIALLVILQRSGILA